MGAVIAFRPRPKPMLNPGPSTPEWRQRLWAQWMNPANWEPFKDAGARMFSAGEFAAILYPETEEEAYFGYWGFAVFDGPASAAQSEFVWCSQDYAKEAAWGQLMKMVRKRERA